MKTTRIILRCDRCGAENEKRLEWTHVNLGNPEGQYRKRRIARDLCPACTRDLVEWVRTKP